MGFSKVMKEIRDISETAPYDQLRVRVSRATERIWEGDALSVSSTNSHGAFDVLPQHANFVTLIKNADVLVEDARGGKHTFTFRQCVLHVHMNTVNVYADIV